MTNVNWLQLGKTFILVTSALFIILILFMFWPESHFGNSLYFGEDLTLATSTNSSSFMEGGLAATEGGNVYVVYVDGNSVYFRSSQDNGAKFGDLTLLDNGNHGNHGNRSSSPQQTGPKIAATEKGYVYVVWVDGNSVYFRSSVNNGVNFTNPVLLSENDRIASSPQIAATEKGYVYVVWADQNPKSRDIDIIMKTSSDRGMEFGNEDRLSRKNDILSLSPQLAATERGDVYFVRTDKDNMTGKSEIIYRSSSNNGEDFSRNTPLDRDPDDFTVSRSPGVAGTELGDTYVAWSDNNIEFKEILRNGTWYSDTVAINNVSSLGFSPQIAATEKGDVYLLWVSQINNTNTKDLLFKRITHEFLK